MLKMSHGSESNDNVKPTVHFGIMGHVDAGKTSLLRQLHDFYSDRSTLSVSALDRLPESKRRGITIDLGFSCLETSTKNLVFIDNPGHGQYFTKVVGSSSIISCAIIVVNGAKGIQTQTLECFVLSEILFENIIVVINKIDLISDKKLQKLHKLIETNFTKSKKFKTIPIIHTSCIEEGKNSIEPFVELLQSFDPPIKKESTENYSSESSSDSNSVFSYDHVLHVPGRGIVVTGTVLKGKLNIGTNFVWENNTFFKIRSMQSFKVPKTVAVHGDRVAVNITGMTDSNSNLPSRGILSDKLYKGIKHPENEYILATFKIHYLAHINIEEENFSQNEMMGAEDTKYLEIMIGHKLVQAKIYLTNLTEDQAKNDNHFIKTQRQPLGRCKPKIDSWLNERFQIAVIKLKESIEFGCPLVGESYVGLKMGLGYDSKMRIFCHGKILNIVPKNKIKWYRTKRRKCFITNINDDKNEILCQANFANKLHVEKFRNNKIFIEDNNGKTNQTEIGTVGDAFGGKGKFRLITIQNNEKTIFDFIKEKKDNHMFIQTEIEFVI